VLRCGDGGGAVFRQVSLALSARRKAARRSFPIPDDDESRAADAEDIGAFVELSKMRRLTSM
jgi:hypothetical protein